MGLWVTNPKPAIDLSPFRSKNHHLIENSTINIEIYLIRIKELSSISNKISNRVSEKQSNQSMEKLTFRTKKNITEQKISCCQPPAGTSNINWKEKFKREQALEKKLAIKIDSGLSAILLCFWRRTSYRQCNSFPKLKKLLNYI